MVAGRRQLRPHALNYFAYQPLRGVGCRRINGFWGTVDHGVVCRSVAGGIGIYLHLRQRACSNNSRSSRVGCKVGETKGGVPL